MLSLYILSEDDFDDQVYVNLVEWLQGEKVEPIPRRLRRGGGVGEVRKKLALFMSDIRRSGRTEATAFLVAIDNDRALEHPAHVKQLSSRAENCRHCGLESALGAGLPDGRPVPGAFAVPVEMIESWLLLIHDPRRFPNDAALPRFSWRDQAATRASLGATPPPQLKDLVDEICTSDKQSKLDFALSCVLKLDAQALGKRSASFERFRLAVAAWP